VAIFPSIPPQAPDTTDALSRYELLARYSRDIILFVRRDGRILEANSAAVQAYGYSHDELLSRCISDLRATSTHPALENDMAAAEGTGALFETLHRRKDGSVFPVEVSSQGIELRDQRILLSIVRDISARKSVEAERDVAIEFLRLVNAHTGVADLIEASVRFFHQQTGCEAVGIRLRQGDDYPYYEARGFPEEFLQAENSLCSRCANGEVERDSVGNAILACMCGNVIGGRFDPTKPFFTPSGSFWSNCTSDLLASTTAADRQARTRNRCNGEGYESVALIALRVGENRLGLLQLNDHRKNMFTLARMAQWERLAGYLAVAISQALSQEALRQSAELNRATLQAMSASIAVIDRQGQILVVNDRWVQFACENAAGALPSVQVGGNYFEVCRRASTDENSDGSRALAGIEAVLHGELEHFSMEYACHSAQEQRWFLMTVGPLGPNGQRGVVITHRNITDNKLAEEAIRNSEATHRAIFQFASVGLSQSEWGTAKFLRVNDTLCQITGYSAQELLTMRFSDLDHPDDRARGLATYQKTLTGETNFYEIEKRYVRKDGRVIWVHNNVTVVRDGAGRPLYYLGVTQDITERREWASQLQQAKERAESASHAKDQFIAVLSHELRTPLMPVLITAQVMETDATLSSEQLESVRMIRRNVELEARLIDDLLDLTRITRGKLEMHFAPVDLHDRLGHVLAMCSDEVASKGLKLTVDLAAAGRHVTADPARLQQILWNLLKNAVKFTPVGGAITVRTANPTSAIIELVVQDTGVGIEPGLLPRLFNAFEQGGRDVTRQFGGLGLGLVISKGLVDLHGGTLSAHSAGRNQGATFTLTLPTVHARTHSEPDRPLVSLRSIASKQRVLLVEDHPDTARVMTTLLVKYGFEVTLAGSVHEAFEASQAGAFDLLISDIGLPDGSGLDLLPKITAIRPMKAIALSGFGMEDDVRKSKEAGFLAHLTKPVDLRVFEQILRDMLTEVKMA